MLKHPKLNWDVYGDREMNYMDTQPRMFSQLVVTSSPIRWVVACCVRICASQPRVDGVHVSRVSVSSECSDFWKCVLCLRVHSRLSNHRAVFVRPGKNWVPPPIKPEWLLENSIFGPRKTHHELHTFLEFEHFEEVET